MDHKYIIMEHLHVSASRFSSGVPYLLDVFLFHKLAYTVKMCHKSAIKQSVPWPRQWRWSHLAIDYSWRHGYGRTYLFCLSAVFGCGEALRFSETLVTNKWKNKYFKINSELGHSRRSDTLRLRGHQLQDQDSSDIQTLFYLTIVARHCPVG